MKLITDYTAAYLLIPPMAWGTVDDNYEPGQPIGFGPTAEASIADYFDNLTQDWDKARFDTEIEALGEQHRACTDEEESKKLRNYIDRLVQLAKLDNEPLGTQFGASLC